MGKKDDDDDDDEPAEAADAELKSAVANLAQKYGLEKLLDVDKVFEAFSKCGIMNTDGLEIIMEAFDATSNRPKPTDVAPVVFNKLMQELEKAGVPASFWLLMKKENSGQSVELRTWRFGAQISNSHRIYLNADGVIKETKSSMGMSHKAEYFKVKTGITDFTKKSRMGSSDFTFKNADTGKDLVFKKVKNAKQVFEFIENKILNLDFPKGGHW